MPPKNRKRKIYMSWERFNQTLNSYVPLENKGKYKSQRKQSKDFHAEGATGGAL